MKIRMTSVISVGLAIILAIILAIYASNSFAYQDNNNYVLFYNENVDILKEDITFYIDKIDDYLLPNSSFIYSDILTENYDFLTNFAMNYIINNKSHYQDKIVILDTYYYNDKYYNLKSTKEYIDKKEIYKITDSFFGIKDYIIINDNIKIVNDNVSLINYSGSLFNGKIVDLKLEDNGNNLKAIVYYDSGDNYQYTFKKINNILKLYNVEV